MVSRAATALMADLLSSSCFSNSCLTELAFVFACIVDLRGSISFSIPVEEGEDEGEGGEGGEREKREGGRRGEEEGKGEGERRLVGERETEKYGGKFHSRCNKAAGLK